MNIEAFWEAVIEQKADVLRTFFHKDAYINWHCSNEHFSVEEYIQANCEYPGESYGMIERTESVGDLTILVGNILSKDKSLSLHVVSFIRTRDNKIISMDEYYGDHRYLRNGELRKILEYQLNKILDWRVIKVWKKIKPQ